MSPSLLMTLTGPWTPQNGCCGPSVRLNRLTKSNARGSTCGGCPPSRKTAAVRIAGATEVGSAGLPPWREVPTAHDDVARQLPAAEFAADLAMVARGEGDPEYTDPVEFFRRTFLTGACAT